MIVIGACVMAGPATLDLLLAKTLDATILASRPMCSVSWTSAQRIGGTLYHKQEMGCGDVASFRAHAPDAVKWTVVEGMALTVGYTTPSGANTTFEQFVPTAAALSMIREGHTSISYRAARDIPARISSKSGASTLDLVWMLILPGLLFFFAPEIRAWKSRRFPSVDRFLGVRKQVVEGAPASAMSLPIKVAVIAVLPAIFLLSVLLHQNLALILKPVLLVGIVLGFLVARRRK